MGNKYIVAAAISVLLVLGLYVFQFYIFLGYSLSKSTAVWAQLGEYFGGMLSPVLSFITLVLLIKSLTLQNEANKTFRDDIESKERTERLRSFEVMFFGLIDSQKKIFESFEVDFIRGGRRFVEKSAGAVIAIEDAIEDIRRKGGSEDRVREFIERIDQKNEQVYGLTRAFYVIVKLITERLNEADGFSKNDRKNHLLTLVHYTDFSQLRMIMISLQFMDYYSAEYLRGNGEFSEVLSEVELSFDLY